jgi:hypothetical protein
MIRKIIVAVLLLSIQNAFAQKYVIKGQLLDSLSGPLPSATVLLLQQKDSTLIKFGVSDVQGNFEIKGVTKGEYIFKVSYLGFATHAQKVSAAGELLEISLGQVKLLSNASQLGEVVVQAEKAPVTVKRDTIEFNAGSFKTKTNATVEDLLKKLPGVEVETDGTVKAQGEEVRRVMVDGREFFGQDPKMATRNLPADAVEKVQVFDKKSDQAVFTGIDDGQKEKTINLELKEEKRHGAFGNSMVGVGDKNHYTAKTNINKFNNGNQLSVLAMGNNINQQGFGIGEYLNFSGGAGGTGGGGGMRIEINAGGAQSGGAQLNTGQQNGLVTNYAGGANINQNYNRNKTKLNGSYFYNRLDQNLLTNLQRIYNSPNGTNDFDQISNQNITNDNHKVNLTVDHKIDSVNSLKFNSSLVYNLSDQRQFKNGKMWEIGNLALANESDQATTAKGNGLTLNSSLLLRHRFAKKGRTLSTNLTFGYSQDKSDGALQSVNTFYRGQTVVQNVNQINSQTTTNPSYGVNASYTEPLGRRKYLEFNYNFNANVNSVNRDVFDVKNEQKTFNQTFSNQYTSNYLYNRPGVNFRMNREKFNFSVGTAFQNTRLNGDLISTNQKIDRTFTAVLPSAHFNYDYNTFKHLRIDYSTSMQEPTIAQLQPIINNYTDQQNQSVGNPELRPSYVHQLRTNFNLFNPTSFMNVFARVNANYTTNAITNSQTQTQTGWLSKPINVRNSMSLNANINLGIPIKPLNSRLNFGPTFNMSNGINFTNDIENTVNQQTVGGSIRYNYSLNDILIVDLGTTLSKQLTEYSFNTNQNQSFFNKTYNAEVNVNFLKAYALNTEMNYFVYTSQTSDFSQAIPLWNVSLSRYILKNKVGELKVGVNNLLNRSQTASQTASANYLQQQTMNNLGRFLMVSFTYALNKQLNPMGEGGRRRGGRGMMMMIND